MLKSNKVQFDDCDLPPIIYSFNKSDDVKYFMRGSQTLPVQYEDAETTTKKQGRTVKLQVSEDVILNSSKPQDDQEQQNNIKYNEQDLQDFLKRVYPLIENALTTPIKSLEYYEPKWVDQRKEITLLYTLSCSLNQQYERDTQLEITDISWNCTGLMLAAAYGKFEHMGSSNERAFLCVWNLSKRDFQQDKPTIKIETESSLTAVEFHPSKPSWLVGGSFNGEIFFWDLSNEEESLIAKSNIDDYFHREAITQLIWLESKKVGSMQATYSLLSLSTDGKILLWDKLEETTNTQNPLQYPTKGYFLVRKKDGAVVSVGGLCFAQSNEDKNTFIIGSEAGSVLRGLISGQTNDQKNKNILEQQQGNTKITWKQNTYSFMMNVFNKYILDIKMHVEKYCVNKGLKEVDCEHIFASKPDIRKTYINPVSFAFEPHMGPVYSIQFSPFIRNLFITCSLDGSVKLYDLLQAKPLFTIDNFGNYIFKTQWSPNRAGVFASVLSNGEVHFYDLLENKKYPLNIIECKDLEQGTQAINIKFNQKQNDLVAVAYTKCKIRIYQLSDNLIIPKKEEMFKFQQLIEEFQNQ